MKKLPHCYLSIYGICKSLSVIIANPLFFIGKLILPQPDDSRIRPSVSHFPLRLPGCVFEKSKNKKATKTHGYIIRNTLVAYRVILIRFDNFVKRIF